MFPTKCNNNLAIDYADQNYFASSALDHPGVMVWDRRATARSVASHSYLEAVDVDGIPWGGALRLDRVLDVESDPALIDSKNSMIRSLRYCRDHSGMLAVLSRTGQLRILSTKPEFTSPSKEIEGSPALLQVRESHEMDYRYLDPGRKNDRIVSFDWVALGSSVQRPRLLVLRANGAFEILEKPSFTSTYPFKLIAWQPPHRGLEGMRVDNYVVDIAQTNMHQGAILTIAQSTWSLLRHGTCLALSSSRMPCRMFRSSVPKRQMSPQSFSSRSSRNCQTIISL